MKCALHKIFTIVIPLLLLVNCGRTEEDDCYDFYDTYYNSYTDYCTNDSVVGAIIGGVIGGLFALGIFVVVIVKCCLHKTAQRPGRMVNPTAVPTVTQTRFGGTYGSNFSHHTTTQFGTQFTYSQHQQSQPNPYHQESDHNSFPPSQAYTY
ncbi:unnamed protein product [Mytilus edulis]|uniref:Uncharacterized protein n=1 Tax=Mytilus edulis TaxID=6550 RepID=A0A8S3VPP7_MYTED|nr:unnamed protein product [Mytilus edulis]